MHKKIMSECSKKLMKDVDHYKKEEKSSHGIKKKHEKVEEKEALSAAQAMKRRAKKAHEY
jgi:hypothetical protein